MHENVRKISKLGNVAYFGKFSKLGENLSLNLENASQIKGCVRYIFASLFFASKREHF